MRDLSPKAKALLRSSRSDAIADASRERVWGAIQKGLAANPGGPLAPLVLKVIGGGAIALAFAMGIHRHFAREVAPSVTAEAPTPKTHPEAIEPTPDPPTFIAPLATPAPTKPAPRRSEPRAKQAPEDWLGREASLLAQARLHIGNGNLEGAARLLEEARRLPKRQLVPETEAVESELSRARAAKP